MEQSSSKRRAHGLAGVSSSGASPTTVVWDLPQDIVSLIAGILLDLRSPLYDEADLWCEPRPGHCCHASNLTAHPQALSPS